MSKSVHVSFAGEQPKKKKKKHSHIYDAAAGTRAEPVSDVLTAASLPAAATPQVAADATTATAAEAATNTAAEAATNTTADAATNTTADAATNTAAATPAAGPATSSATRKQSAKDQYAKDLDVGTSRADEAAPVAGTSKPESGQDQSDGAAPTLQVVADAEQAPFIIHKPGKQRKRKSSANHKALLRTPDAGAGPSTGLQAADQDGAAAAAAASDPEAAALLTAAQPVTQTRHRLSHSTGPEDIPAADLATGPAEKPKAKKKQRKSSLAAAADEFPAESLAVAGQAGVPVPETATATELKQALAPLGAPVFQQWLSFPELAALHGMPEMAEPGYFPDTDGAAGADDGTGAGPSTARAGDAGADPSTAGEAGPSEAKPAAEEAAAKPPKAIKRRKQSSSKVSVAFCTLVNTVSVTSSNSAQH